MSRDRISACVITFNEEQNIRRCLDSVKWCDEIVVVDSFSTDLTVQICREYTPHVYQCEWKGYIAQRNLIREKASHPWVLFLDADEEVSPELRDEIVRNLDAGHNGVVGYEFPRMVNYLGEWIRHGEWYPDVKLRLFLKCKGTSGGQEPHDQVIVNGPVKRLRGHLYHYTYDNLHDQLVTLNRYSTITANEKFKLSEKFRWVEFLFRPPLRFLKAYILKHGFLDGRRGFLIAAISSFGVATKYAKLWELELEAKRRVSKSDSDQKKSGPA